MAKVICKLLLSCFLLVTLSLTSHAQQKQGVLREIRTEPISSSVYAPLPQSTASIATDTLRNFFKGDTVFRWPAAALFQDATGWIHGTNSFEDISKATRITLPDNATAAMLEEVHVTFIHKASTVTSESYSIEIYNVDSNSGGPGTLLGSQAYSYQFVDADEDLATPAFTTLHILDTPVPVPNQFFVSVNLGPYDSSGYSNIDIASTDALGVAVPEDWEQLSNGNWVNMSESWFSAGDDGWHMWIEAVVDIQAPVGGPPVITHNAPASAPEGQAVTISAEIQSPTGVATAAIAYVEGGNSIEQAILQLMSNVGGNTWQGTIPASAVNTSGFSYAIGAADNSGISSNTPDFSVSVSTEGLVRNLGFSGADASDYRLFSIPIDLINKNADNVLEDDLGPYDPEVWRLFGLGTNQTYVEFPNTDQMRPGVGFWLASRESGFINTGPGVSTSLATPLLIQLNPGWTFIGTPFNFSLPQNQLALVSGETLDIRTFNGSWSTQTGPLEPFAGYAIASTAATQLLISPFPPTAGKNEELASEEEYAWAIRITATANEALDADNVAAVSENAAYDWDTMDRPEPPVIGKYISLYFPHDEWALPFKRFSTDVQPIHALVNSWDFEISSNVEEYINLQFEGIEEIPEALDIVLLDKLLNREIDLRTTASYQVKASEAPYDKRFKLVVGSSGDLEAIRLEQQELPTQLAIESFPNPFQRESTILISLREQAEFSLHVYNSIGQRVAVLAQGETRDAGVHPFSWQGVDDHARPLASGLYFFVLETTDRRITQQTVLLR